MLNLLCCADTLAGMPHLAQLLTGNTSYQRRKRRKIHADLFDEQGQLRSDDDLRKLKRQADHSPRKQTCYVPVSERCLLPICKPSL